MRKHPVTPTRDQIGIEDIPAFKISNWKAFSKNTLLGFFDVELPSGLILRGLMLHSKNESRWVSMPARPYKKADGQEARMPMVEISEHARADFQRLALEAIDVFLEGAEC